MSNDYVSQNGETDFFSKVYSDQGPILESDSVPYDSWLYSFSVGMIFRGLATEHFAAALPQFFWLQIQTTQVPT